MIVREYASIVYELTRRVRQGNGQRLRQTHRAADGQPRHRAVGALHADANVVSSVSPLRCEIMQV